jgi:hypothetical protein
VSTAGSTPTIGFAADLLQIQQSEIIDTRFDCRRLASRLGAITTMGDDHV